MDILKKKILLVLMYIIEDSDGLFSPILTEQGVGSYLGLLGFNSEHYTHIRHAIIQALDNPNLPIEIRTTGCKIMSLDPAVEYFLVERRPPLDPNFYKKTSSQRTVNRKKSKSPQKSVKRKRSKSPQKTVKRKRSRSKSPQKKNGSSSKSKFTQKK